MSETAAPALKEIFNREKLQHIADQTKAVHAPFDVSAFMSLATENLEALGIMQRMRQVATSLHATLPGDYARNIDILTAAAPASATVSRPSRCQNMLRSTGSTISIFPCRRCNISPASARRNSPSAIFCKRISPAPLR